MGLVHAIIHKIVYTLIKHTNWHSTEKTYNGTHAINLVVIIKRVVIIKVFEK